MSISPLEYNAKPTTGHVGPTVEDFLVFNWINYWTNIIIYVKMCEIV